MQNRFSSGKPKLKKERRRKADGAMITMERRPRMKDKAAIITKEIQTQPRAVMHFKSLKPIASLVDIKAPQDP